MLWLPWERYWGMEVGTEGKPVMVHLRVCDHLTVTGAG